MTCIFFRMPTPLIPQVSPQTRNRGREHPEMAIIQTAMVTVRLPQGSSQMEGQSHRDWAESKCNQFIASSVFMGIKGLLVFADNKIKN